MAHPRDAEDLDERAAQRPRCSADFSHVPHTILSGRIFDFLVHFESPEFLRDGFDPATYQGTLTPLASVCREWRDIAQTRLSEAKRRCCTLTRKNGTAEDLQRLLRQAAELGPTARELTIVMEDVLQLGALRQHHANREAYQNKEWWEALLAYFPNIVRLELALVSVPRVRTVLEIASRLCPKVKSLGMLCWLSRQGDEDPRKFPKDTKVLCVALERWHASNGGLRALTIPNFVGHEKSEYKKFFRSVAANCPQIEYLLTTNKHQAVKDMERRWPKLSSGAWGDFCRNCPLLRELPGGIAPWTTKHVAEFTAAPKLQLEDLTIMTKIGDPWHDDLSILRQVIDAAPQLESLTVVFTGNPHRAHGVGGAEPWLTQPDKIMRFVAEHCSKLKRIKVKDRSKKQVHRLSADAVDALVTMKSVCDLELQRVLSLSDYTLVEMLRCTLESPALKTRFVAINVSDYTYNAILQLLQFMAEQPPERFDGVSLQLTVGGSYGEKENGDVLVLKPDRKLQPKNFKHAVEAVKQIHSKTLSFILADVAVMRVDNRIVRYVEEFHLLLNVDKQHVEALKKAKAYERSDYDASYEEVEGKDVGGIIYQEERAARYY